MSETVCTYTKPNGDPCAARPFPGSAFCLFHDPAHAQALAEARARGGATPRRRCRRYPRLLDSHYVGELLSELFIDALNHPEAIDTRRLQALTSLSRALLKAVGTPPTFLFHRSHAEPPAETAHLLRRYPPEDDAVFEAAPPLELDPEPPHTAASPELPDGPPLWVGDAEAWRDRISVLPEEPPAAAPLDPQPLNARTPERRTPEQDLNRPSTSPPGTSNFDAQRQPSEDHQPLDPPSDEPLIPTSPEPAAVPSPGSPPPPPAIFFPCLIYQRPPGFSLAGWQNDPPWFQK